MDNPKIAIEQIEQLINDGAQTVKEIADEIGVSATSISVRLKRRKDLRTKINDNREQAKAQYYAPAIQKIDELIAGGMSVFSACKQEGLQLYSYNRYKHKARRIKVNVDTSETLTQKYAAILSKSFGVAA